MSLASTALPSNLPPALKASEAGFIMCTNAAGIVRTIIQQSLQPAQLSGQLQNFLSGQKNTVPKELDSRNFTQGNSCDY